MNYPRMTYISDMSNLNAIVAFIGPVPPCPTCHDSGEYETETGPAGCMPCNSRCLAYIDYKGERHTLDWGETLEKREDGLHLIPSSYDVGGLVQNKYYIRKSGTGAAYSPGAEYFVLRIDKDPHARVALHAYAMSVCQVNPILANDLMQWLERIEKKDASR